MINSNVFDYINVLDKAADASWTRNFVDYHIKKHNIKYITLVILLKKSYY